PRHAPRRGDVGVRPERSARRCYQRARIATDRGGRGARPPARDERPRRAAAVRVRHRGDEGDARRRGDRGHRARLRRWLRRVGDERGRQRGDAGGARGAGDPRHHLPRRQAAPPGRRAVGREGRHDLRAVRAAAGAAGRGGAARGRLHARGHDRPRGARRASAAVAQGDLQRRHQPDRRADRPHPRAGVRGPRAAAARVAARGRGEGGGEGAGDRARRRPRGADRPRRPAGRRLRPQGEHAAGRRGAPADRDRLPERRHRALRARPGRADAAQRRRHRPDQRSREVVDLDLRAELERRLANVRAAMAAHELDALVVSGSEYTGFEGAVTYLSGFQIVHRYAYVVVPAEGDPFVVFPSEARYVGEHGTALVEQVFVDRPGAHIADRARGAGWRRIGVYGLDYVMAVRDYRALEGLDLVPFDVEFDHARAVKSEAELASVRESVRINERGFEVFFEHYAPGRPAAEVMAAAEQFFVAEGCGRLTMNMVLTGPSGKALPEFKIARREEALGDFMLPSLEVAGPGMHWVEVSRAVAAEPGCWSSSTARMLEAYE